jgi:hypothetical protein
MLISLCFLIMFSSPAYSVTFTSNTIIDWNNTLYESQDIIIDGCTLTINGEHTFNNLSVINNGRLKHSPAPNGEAENKLFLYINNNVTIDSTSGINCDGLGYGAAKGPGAGGYKGSVGGGGGYGGKGGNGKGSSYYQAQGGGAYGSAAEPINLGSGGGNPTNAAGGPGGGAIYLSIGGILHLDGSISANGNGGGTDLGGGGGSGGSIWVTTSTLSGTGAITSHGGAGSRYKYYSPYLHYYYSGGGAGGRIALYYNTKTYSGTTAANGSGSGYRAGEPGTIENSTSPEQVYGPIQQIYPSIAGDLSNYENIVFITHGWNGIFATADHSWIDDMTNNFNSYFLGNNMPSWKAISYNWQEHAGKWHDWASTSSENACKIGWTLGEQISSWPNCKHLHLVSHSAGAWMIDTISKIIKSNRPEITIHITFLDAYAPAGVIGVNTLGEHGDWVEHYVDHRRELGCSFGVVDLAGSVQSTNTTLDNAYNIDITGEDTALLRTGWGAHGWPKTWYDDTIPNSTPSVRSWGFASSLEGGKIPSLELMQQAFPRGERESIPPDFIPPPSIDHIKEMTSNPTYWGTYVPSYSSPADVEFDETQLIINSGETVQALQAMSLSVTATETTGAMPSDISWFYIKIDANELVNALSFDSEFTSLAGAESILDVYWEDQLIGSIDERYVFDGVQKYIYFLPEIYQPGSYKLAFKLATYNDTVSSIEIDNFRLKLYRASHDLCPDNKIDFLDYAILAKEWSMQKRPEDLAPEEGDGIINLLDFAVLASSWGQEPSQDMEKLKDISENWLATYKLPISDIAPYPNGDGVVDILDLQIIAENWLEGTSSQMDTNDINDGLITYYKFDGTSGPVVDEAGNNDANNVNDSATRGVTGKVGNAFYFNGSSSWVESDFNAGITGNSDWAISFWMYTNNPLGTTNLVSLGAYGTAFEIIGIAPGNTYLELFVNLWESSWNEYFGVGFDLTGAWNHIAATYDGADIRFFVNGSLKRTKPVTLNLLDDKIRIGGNPGGYAGLYFDGWIDEVKIWNRTLSDSEVQYLFQHP